MRLNDDDRDNETQQLSTCGQRVYAWITELSACTERLARSAADQKVYSESGGSVAEWLACWTQAQKARVQTAVATLSGNSLRQTVHIHCASVHQAAKLTAALLRVAEITAGLAESNGSLPPGL